MSRRNLRAKRLLHDLKKQSASENPNIIIILDFNRSREDTETLTGYSDFLSAVHKVTPMTPDWEWSEEQIQIACDKCGMNPKSIIFSSKSNELKLVHEE